ncbi:hypothetical protein [Leptolyngbya sp. FACHB-261]|uniref:hypothetical protein n=1 Tax=Leptolyngbya sp. FACHB-261 TaxID=2692806 RepID=UPI0016852EF8|nr:hypothetical protein [Leptolyngbya sp. FACHB-261]MBD2102109.1 hypothetical protein [Leptolyngbya sp. FACHB-261]
MPEDTDEVMTGSAQEMAEKSRNARAGEGPTNSGDTSDTTVEEHIHSISDPEATDIPTSNAPDPKNVNPNLNANATKKPVMESTDKSGK